MKLLDRLRRRKGDMLYVGLRTEKYAPGGPVTFPTSEGALSSIDAVAGPGGLSWSCMVCGKMRPDAEIAVASCDWDMGGFSLRVNVRYCRDRESCREAAWRRAEVDAARFGAGGKGSMIDKEGDR